MRLTKAERAFYADGVSTFQRETGQTEFDIRTVTRWLIEKGYLGTPEDVEQFHASRISEALRHREGEAGRNWYTVTEMVPGESSERMVQRVLWSHFDVAPESFLRTAMLQRMERLAENKRAFVKDLERIESRYPDLGRQLRQTFLHFDQQD